MKRTILLLLLFCAVCKTNSGAEVIFKNKSGCFLLFNMRSNQFESVIGEARCRERLPACSTFKVPLAVIAFDSGALRDEKEILKWDGSRRMLDEWNRDHNAVSWMRESVVWFSQRLTVKIGQKTMEKYIEAFKYGNRDFSGGLTEAWLVSPASTSPALKISAYEQIDFMKALWTNGLPAADRAKRLAREITYLETSENGFELHGKTGSNFYDSDKRIRLGWFTGHVGRKDEEYLVVTSFNDLQPTDEKEFGGKAAKEITKALLKENKLW